MAILREAIEGSAPDAASLKAAQKLESSKKYVSLGRAGDLVWGDCQGSGSAPYHVAFDGDGAAFKCSCPSRKVPCKHSLGLALRAVELPAEFAEGAELPSWVVDWQKARARRAARAAEGPKPVDATAQAKRASARDEKVAGGVAELEMWLRDIVRGGLAGLPSRPYNFWDKIAARMTDAQCAGLARRLRDMAGVANQGGAWHEEMLHRLGGLHLILEGYKRLDSLSPERQADIRALIGWNVDQSDLLQSGVPLSDNWVSLCHTIEESADGLRSGRTWLWSERSSRAALILQFERGGYYSDGAGLAPAAPVGLSFGGDLVFFPGSLPQRAVIKERGELAAPGFVPRGIEAQQVLGEWARALALFPWLDSLPCVLSDVVPLRYGERMWLRDGSGALEASTRRIDEWALLAASGGRALGVFGLWNGRQFEPLATIGDGLVAQLPPRAS